MAIKIDYGTFHCVAHHQTGDFPEIVGYLNRHTGEIVCFCEDAEKWAGTECAVDLVFDRARIDASPRDWLEIPKFDRVRGEQYDAEDNRFRTFRQDFFRANGIDAEMS